MSIEANLKDKRVTVIGGSGFVGRYIVRRLAKAGAVIRVAVRDVERAGFLRMSGEVGQVVPVVADVTRPASLSAATEGADVVINLVGILYPSGNNSFRSAQALGAAAAAKAAKEAGATQFIQVSAIGANAKSKLRSLLFIVIHLFFVLSVCHHMHIFQMLPCGAAAAKFPSSAIQLHTLPSTKYNTFLYIILWGAGR